MYGKLYRKVDENVSIILLFPDIENSIIFATVPLKLPENYKMYEYDFINEKMVLSLSVNEETANWTNEICIIDLKTNDFMKKDISIFSADYLNTVYIFLNKILSLAKRTSQTGYFIKIFLSY